MKPNIQLIAALCLALILVNCKKSDNTPTANIDAIVGTYTGSMYVFKDDGYNPSYDSMIAIVTIYKISADSFAVSHSLLSDWYSSNDSFASHIHFNSSNIYTTTSFLGYGFDSLRFVPKVDSIFFHSHYDIYSGSTGEHAQTITFSGRK